MVPQVEYGSLYKFVASVGVILIAAAFAVPWLFAQSTSVLTIPSEDLDALTETAREALLVRQQAMASAQSLIPWVVGALLVIGLALLAWAIWKWRRSQRNLDDLEDSTTAIKRAAASKLTAEAQTPSEIEQRLTSEADDVPRSPSAEPPSVAAREADRLQRMAVLRGVESRTVKLLSAAYPRGMLVAENVKVTSGTAPGAVFDVLLDPKSETPWAQLAIDIRVVSGRFADIRINDWAVRLAAATEDIVGGSVYTGKKGRPPAARTAGVFILIVQEAEIGRQSPWLTRLLHRISTVNRVLRRPLGFVIATEERFAAMTPVELRDAIAAVWAESPSSVNTFV